MQASIDEMRSKVETLNSELSRKDADLKQVYNCSYSILQLSHNHDVLNDYAERHKN
jgi:hypothetical protein